MSRIYAVAEHAGADGVNIYIIDLDKFPDDHPYAELVSHGHGSVPPELSFSFADGFDVTEFPMPDYDTVKVKLPAYVTGDAVIYVNED